MDAQKICTRDWLHGLTQAGNSVLTTPHKYIALNKHEQHGWPDPVPAFQLIKVGVFWGNISTQYGAHPWIYPVAGPKMA